MPLAGAQNVVAGIGHNPHQPTAKVTALKTGQGPKGFDKAILHHVGCCILVTQHAVGDTISHGLIVDDKRIEGLGIPGQRLRNYSLLIRGGR